MKLTGKNRFLCGAVPKDISGAGVSTPYINMGRVDFAAFMVSIGVSAAVAAITLTQAKDAAGTGAKSVKLTQYHENVGLSTDALTKVEATGDTFNTVATANNLYIVEADSRDLDEDFGFVRLNVSDPAASVLCAIDIVTDSGRFMEFDAPTLL